MLSPAPAVRAVQLLCAEVWGAGLLEPVVPGVGSIHHSDTETIHGLALSLESVDDVLGGDGLALGVIGVDQRVADDDVEERLEDLTCLWVDCRRDSLDTTTTGETADSRFRDSRKDVLLLRSVLGLAKTFSLTFSRH